MVWIPTELQGKNLVSLWAQKGTPQNSKNTLFTWVCHTYQCVQINALEMVDRNILILPPGPGGKNVVLQWLDIYYLKCKEPQM